MKCSRRFLTTFVAFAFLYYFLAFPREAYAYLDPGTGSIILQVVIGVLFAAVLAIKLFWQQITAFLGRLFSKSEKNEKPED